MKKTLSTIAVTALVTGMASAVTLLTVIESGTWFNSGAALSNEGVTTIGSTGLPSINANGGLFTLIVFDTETSGVGTITGGTLDFTITSGTGSAATGIEVDFLGTTSDADFDDAEGWAFAAQTIGVTNVFSDSAAAGGDVVSIDLTAAQIDDGANRYAVYRFFDPTLAGDVDSSNDIRLYSLIAVPEPSSTALLGLGGLALLLRRRR